MSVIGSNYFLKSVYECVNPDFYYTGSRIWLVTMLVYQSFFVDGVAQEWFQHFEIYAVNEWNDATKLLKLPTLLEGEALAVWLELSTESKAD